MVGICWVTMLMVTMMVLREQAGCYYPALVANRYERNLKSPSATLTAPTDDDERMQKVSPGVRNLKQWQKELVPCDLPPPPNPLLPSSWASGSAAWVILWVIQPSSFSS